MNWLKASRRLLRFGLRSLFVLVTLLCVLLVWRQSFISSYHAEQRAALVLTQKFDGQVEVSSDYAVPKWLRPLFGEECKYTQSINLNGQRVLDSDLQLLRPFSKLEILYLNHTQVTDDGMEHLKALRHLESLHLNDTNITDAGLSQLANLRRLKELQINGTHVTDIGLRHLQVTNLVALGLGNTQLSDNGLQQLATARKLEFLYVAHVKISDKGILQLQGLPALRELYLDGTNVSDAAVNRLRKALPNALIQKK